MARGALYADRLDVIELDDTVTTYEGVHYNLGTAGLTTCTIIDPATGHAVTQHRDILRAEATTNRRAA